MLKRSEVISFQKLVYRHYKKYGRHDLPWRKTHDPYCIVVSELMLQQTQVARVKEKYVLFLKHFPTVQCLASASLSQVLTVWSGLGYNRRAKFIHRLAQEVTQHHRGVFPRLVYELETLPGIGRYTARAIAAFAYNDPVVLVETNVRTVFLHHFFNTRKKQISDRDITPFIEATLDSKEPRRWYAALMDYGAFLKQNGITAHRKSASYKKQSAFEGSTREVRGAVIRLLTRGPHTKTVLTKKLLFSSERIMTALEGLIRDELVEKRGHQYSLAKR